MTLTKEKDKTMTPAYIWKGTSFFIVGFPSESTKATLLKESGCRDFRTICAHMSVSANEGTWTWFTQRANLNIHMVWLFCLITDRREKRKGYYKTSGNTLTNPEWILKYLSPQCSTYTTIAYCISPKPTVPQQSSTVQHTWSASQNLPDGFYWIFHAISARNFKPTDY